MSLDVTSAAFHILYWQVQDASAQYITLQSKEKLRSIDGTWDFIMPPYNRFVLSLQWLGRSIFWNLVDLVLDCCNVKGGLGCGINTSSGQELRPTYRYGYIWFNYYSRPPWQSSLGFTNSESKRAPMANRDRWHNRDQLWNSQRVWCQCDHWHVSIKLHASSR